ncbi:MAG: glycosyltransferase, partial [Actinomycetota bacterium]
SGRRRPTSTSERAKAAAVWRVPLVVAEQNAVAGAANRVAARFAKAAAVAFPDTGLPNAELTGNPVRAEIAELGRRRATAGGADRSVGDPPTVLVFGGSLGARRINEAAVEVAARWAPSPRVRFRHVIGERDWERPRPEALSDPASGHVAVRYEEDMAAALADADLVVSRAGATTVAELTAVGVGAVFVPLPIATADHQTANARAMVDAGAAVLVPDDELDGDRLEAELDAVLAEPGRLEAMADAARRLGRPDAAVRVAALVEEHARG